MKIKNRGELTKLINEGFETKKVVSKPGTEIFHTIIYDKRKDCYFRIEWGEIADDSQVNHLWYNDSAPKVTYHKAENKKGWLTKEEENQAVNNEEDPLHDLKISSYLLHNVEHNLVNMNAKNNLKFENVTITGGTTGKGKTLYSVKKMVEALAKGDKVLFFSLEDKKHEVLDKMIKILNNDDFLATISNRSFETKDEKKKYIGDFLLNASLTIHDDFLIGEKELISLIEKKSQEGLDLVVIDGLYLMLGRSELSNPKEFDKLQHILENLGHKLNIQFLLTAQLRM